MIIIRKLSQIKKFIRPVVALGVFDGVHRGHRMILESAVDKARRIRGTSIAVTFWPHPQKQQSLYSLEHRLRLLGGMGVDVCIVIEFNKEFSLTGAEDFILHVLVEKIGAKYIYVGKNFRFGMGAKGTAATLKKASQKYGFTLKAFSVLKSGGSPISSTLIRKLISEGKLAAAQNLLGRAVSILGTVIKGESWGRKLGFPTANINPHHEVVPPPGIYAVRVIFNQKKFEGACYIGSRPTFLRQGKRIEVYIFNFNKNIYRKYIEVQFVKKIREDKKFASPLLLSRQIKKDTVFIKSYFSRHA